MTKGSVLKDIGLYKQQLTNTFVNTDDICELLFDKQAYTEEDAAKLLYTKIFPYLYTDEAQTDIFSCLCFEVDIPQIPTGTIKDMKLVIWAYCHKDIMPYTKEGYAGTRVDILAEMAERQLRDSDAFGIGKLELISVTNFSPQNSYYGKQMIYNVPDFKIKG